jgi:hypothetical protein
VVQQGGVGPLHQRVDLRAGVECVDGGRRRGHLGLADAGLAVGDLALQVGQVHRVGSTSVMRPTPALPR